MQETVLYVDQGNTRAKFWLVRAGEVLSRGSVSDSADLQQKVGMEVITVIVLATVKSAHEAAALLAPWLDVVPSPINVSVCTDILPTAYDDATRLGIDRWLGVLGAWALGEGPALVVDAGTAITVDVLTEQGTHAGGYILPGLVMQQNALAADTARVRFPQADWQGQSLGTNTAAAVGHGSVRAICALVRELACEFGLNRAGHIYLTGGNARDLVPFLPQAEVVDDLLLIGMQAYMRQHAGISVLDEARK